MILAPVWIAISCVEPTSSPCPSATTMTSTFGKSGTFTGLSGLVTNGFVTMILPLGDVNRKMDHDSHSILTGPDCAGAGPADKASIAATAPPIAHRHALAMVPPLAVRWCSRDFDMEAAASDEGNRPRRANVPAPSTPAGGRSAASRAWRWSARPAPRSTASQAIDTGDALASEVGVGLDPRASAVSVDARVAMEKVPRPSRQTSVPPAPRQPGDPRQGAPGHARPPEWETAGAGGPSGAPSGFRP